MMRALVASTSINTVQNAYGSTFTATVHIKVFLILFGVYKRTPGGELPTA